MGLLASIPNNVLTSLLNYFKSRYQPLFNASNTASGTYSARLDEKSGVLTFSGIVQSGPPTVYQLTCDKATVSSVVMWSIAYSPLSDEIVYSSSYQAANGLINFYIGLTNGTQSDSQIIINYQILN